jgi:hypothetical protein
MGPKALEAQTIKSNLVQGIGGSHKIPWIRNDSWPRYIYKKKIIILISKVSHYHVFYNNSNDLCLHGVDFMPPHKRFCGERDPHSIDMSTIPHTNPCIKCDSISKHLPSSA